MNLSSRNRFHPWNFFIQPMAFVTYFRDPPSSRLLSELNGTHYPGSFSARPPSYCKSRVSGTDHWKIERFVALLMLTIIPVSFVFNSPFMNYILAISLSVHAYWGMDYVLTGYCPESALPAMNIVRCILTVLSLTGLCYLNYRGMGVTKALKVLWSLY